VIGEGSRGPRGTKEPVIGSRDERYNLERQLAAVRAILRDCGFSSGAQVAAIVKRIEAEEAALWERFGRALAKTGHFQ
jgi:hypothetical protein